MIGSPDVPEEKWCPFLFLSTMAVPNHAGSQVAKPNLQYVTSHRTASIEVVLLGLRNP